MYVHNYECTVCVRYPQLLLDDGFSEGSCSGLNALVLPSHHTSAGASPFQAQCRIHTCMESCCSDLDLELRPDKCVTISYNGKQIVRDAKVKLLTGSTRSITSGSTKFLGHLLGESLQASRQAASEKIRKRVLNALKSIEQRPIRGEYKVWI